MTEEFVALDPENDYQPIKPTSLYSPSKSVSPLPKASSSSLDHDQLTASPAIPNSLYAISLEAPVYHERQKWMRCGIHCVNNLFQRAIYDKSNFDAICLELTPDARINPHKSLLGLGNYDVNVLMYAINQEGYEHWLAIRPFGSKQLWYELDSKKPQAEAIGGVEQVIEFLTKQLDDGYSELFLVSEREITLKDIYSAKETQASILASATSKKTPSFSRSMNTNTSSGTSSLRTSSAATGYSSSVPSSPANSPMPSQAIGVPSLVRALSSSSAIGVPVSMSASVSVSGRQQPGNLHSNQSQGIGSRSWKREEEKEQMGLSRKSSSRDEKEEEKKDDDDDDGQPGAGT